MSQWFLTYSLYCCCFISAYSFHNYLHELVWKLAEELSLQSAYKRFPSFSGPPAKTIKVTPKNPDFAQIETQREQYIIDL